MWSEAKKHDFIQCLYFCGRALSNGEKYKGRGIRVQCESCYNGVASTYNCLFCSKTIGKEEFVGPDVSGQGCN